LQSELNADLNLPCFDPVKKKAGAQLKAVPHQKEKKARAEQKKSHTIKFRSSSFRDKENKKKKNQKFVLLHPCSSTFRLLFGDIVGD